MEAMQYIQMTPGRGGGRQEQGRGQHCQPWPSDSNAAIGGGAGSGSHVAALYSVQQQMHQPQLQQALLDLNHQPILQNQQLQLLQQHLALQLQHEQHLEEQLVVAGPGGVAIGPGRSNVCAGHDHGGY